VFVLISVTSAGRVMTVSKRQQVRAASLFVLYDTSPVALRSRLNAKKHDATAPDQNVIVCPERFVLLVVNTVKKSK